VDLSGPLSTSAAQKIVQTPVTLNFIALFNERTVSSYSGKSVGPRAWLLSDSEVTLAAAAVV
jgi:hypothetical protein